jgi:transposase
VVHPNAANIDVGNSTHYVAVRPDRDPDPVRPFDCFTADLYRLAEWLQHCGVTTVAMQSTGVYWIPLYEILDARGLEVSLVNARHTKNRPGRKSDVQESRLMKLHSYGLLRNSFHPALYRMLRWGHEYVDEGLQYHEKRHREQHVQLLKKRAAKLGL